MITFYSLVPGGFAPRRASKSANGTLPTNGYRYCEPLRSASGLGWYVYLPMEFWLVWDGSEVRWTIDEGEHWFPLANAIQYPGLTARFAEAAPEACKDFAPPFLLRAVDHNVLQVWTGLMMRTAPGYAALVRSPVNDFWRTDYAAYEGIIETDRWFGPLFTNIMLRRMDAPIIFRTTQPFLQVQPLPISLIAESAGSKFEVHEGFQAFGDEEWQSYRETVVRRIETRSKLGEYAVQSRKRQTNNDV